MPVPVAVALRGSAKKAGDTTAKFSVDTQASRSLISPGTHLADMGARLAHIKASTAAMKATMGSRKHLLPTGYPSIGVPWLVEAMTALHGKAKVAERVPQLANVTISNMPGPPVALDLADGRRVCNTPTSIVMHGIALDITAESDDQQMGCGLMADRRAMPDLPASAAALRVAFETFCLLAAAGAAAPAPSAVGSLAQAGRAVPGGARKRLASGLGSIGQSGGNAVTGAVGDLIGSAVGGAMRGAVRAQVSPRKRAAKPAAPAAPAARSAKASAKPRVGR